MPQCSAVVLGGRVGGNGDNGEVGGNAWWSGSSGGDGGSADAGFPGANAPNIEVALGMLDSQRVLARITASAKRPRYITLDASCPILYVAAHGGDGGDGGNGGDGGFGGAAISDEQPNAGQSGPTGKQGRGGDGGDGGNGANVVIRYDATHSELPLRIGLALRGGAGGAGGFPWGQPGKPGIAGTSSNEATDAGTLFAAEIAEGAPIVH